MNVRRSLALAIAVALVAPIAASTGAAAQTASSNRWLQRRVLNFAHQGGEIEAPSDTMFALRRSLRLGADVLEIDVHATADGQVVVLHDTTVDRVTNGSGRVDRMSLRRIRRLDAAYWFVRGCGTCHDKPAPAYTYRGLATGAKPFPASLRRQGYRPSDFRIPTLREVLKAFPNVLINIEIKNTAPDTTPYEQTIADLLEEFGRDDDTTMIVAFRDDTTERFKLFAPETSTAVGTAGAAIFRITSEGPLPGSPNPRYQALQVPIEFQGITVVTEDFVNDAHANGLAVHVWTVDSRKDMEWLIDIGVDGIMTNRPTLLEQVLTARDAHYKPPRSGY